MFGVPIRRYRETAGESFTYVIPRDEKTGREDPEKLLYDFYFLVGYVYGVDFSQPLVSISGEIVNKQSLFVDPVANWNLEHETEKCIDHLQVHMLEALKYALSAEFRHIEDNTDYFSEPVPYEKMVRDLGPEIAKFIANYLPLMSAYESDATKMYADQLPWAPKQHPEFFQSAAKSEIRHYSEEDYIRSYTVITSLQKSLGVSDVELADMFITIFHQDKEEYEDEDEDEDEGEIDSRTGDYVPPPKTFNPQVSKRSFTAGWFESYGGHAWEMIAEGYKKLLLSQTYGDKIAYIDHAYDLQHNTDTVFNKLKLYYSTKKNNYGYGWIKKALDWKRDVKDMRDFYARVSGSVKSLVAWVSYNKYGRSLEGTPEEIAAQAAKDKIAKEKAAKVAATKAANLAKKKAAEAAKLATQQQLLKELIVGDYVAKPLTSKSTFTVGNYYIIMDTKNTLTSSINDSLLDGLPHKVISTDNDHVHSEDVEFAGDISESVRPKEKFLYIDLGPQINKIKLSTLIKKGPSSSAGFDYGVNYLIDDSDPSEFKGALVLSKGYYDARVKKPGETSYKKATEKVYAILRKCAKIPLGPDLSIIDMTA